MKIDAEKQQILCHLHEAIKKGLSSLTYSELSAKLKLDTATIHSHVETLIKNALLDDLRKEGMVALSASGIKVAKSFAEGNNATQVNFNSGQEGTNHTVSRSTDNHLHVAHNLIRAWKLEIENSSLSAEDKLGLLKFITILEDHPASKELLRRALTKLMG
ncbi:MAG: hypothetical protein IT292_10375 [Deltaproteobacteria bacterium]|nr:hypothetical protein [Deltaproteobacteria bacterium]